MSDETSRRVAEVWHPGAFIQEEIDYRGWTTDDLSNRSHLEIDDVQAVLDGTAPVTTRIALRIGRALGTGPEVWLALQAAWDAWRALAGAKVAPGRMPKGRPVPDAPSEEEQP